MNTMQMTFGQFRNIQTDLDCQPSGGFPREGGTNSRGNLLFGHFFPKLHKNEENLGRGGACLALTLRFVTARTVAMQDYFI